MSTGPATARWSERRAGDRTIWVSDDLFNTALVTIVYRVVAALPHYRNERDNEKAGFLHLKCEWPLDHLSDHPALRAIRDPIVSAVEHFYGAYDPVLNRAHANDQTFGDILTAHVDICPGVSAIYYANDEWQDDWGGETLFYADGEAVAAVAPKPGRVAIFPGDLVHRGGAPSRVCQSSRRTIAFKFKTSATVP